MPEEPESIRVPDNDLDDLVATVARLVNETRAHGQLLDRLAEEADDTSVRPGDGGEQPEPEAESAFILALDEEAYRTELAALTTWVHHLLLPVYGREISTARPWCQRWQDHPEAVARLHALWLAWQQFTDIGAGPSGPSVWHRDHLDPALLQLRSADGPFGACTTSPARPHHRLLPAPEPAAGA
ncbi:DUF4913 domain-containing protein [Streptomyces aidingensis]|uniref:DUF4913 domain-containing protein n=1 Tax=Streptomyces aidingensis TaxID=910347 RepID=A0A1I1KFF6_9ACTN|nr:DUF4913 domain-containing protein [Streptomyces aidingensis]SFC59549.1 protein of unknown function [Streptomyces aidingensis]